MTTSEARSRLARVGPNALPSVPPQSAVRILIDQLRSVMVLLLIVAATIALATGDLIDEIAEVLVIDARIGFVTLVSWRVGPRNHKNT